MMMLANARRFLMASQRSNLGLKFFSTAEAKQVVKVGDKFPSAIVAVVKFEPE
jgi:hypothetical protein